MEASGQSVESIHTLLVEVGIPINRQNIENPSEEFMEYVLIEFFKAIDIDIATVRMLTVDQLKALEITGPENAAIAPLLNLQAVMDTVGREIFFKEFSIMDITSPRHVRTKKHLMLIGNFLLFARNTRHHLQERIDDVVARAQHIQNLRKDHQEILEGNNKKAMETQQKLLEIEKIKNEIAVREKRIEFNKIKLNDNKKLMAEKSQLKEQKIERNKNKRNKLQKRREQLNQLNLQVVKSPKKISAKLEELEEAKNSQQEKREALQEALLHKTALVEKCDKSRALIEKMHSKLLELIDEQKKLNDASKECEKIKGEVSELSGTLSLKEKMGTQADQEVADQAIQEYMNKEKQCQERIKKLKKTCADLENEKKNLEKQKENTNVHQNEMQTEISETKEKIQKVEEEIYIFSKQCQELYDSEIMKIKQLHERIELEQKKE